MVLLPLSADIISRHIIITAIAFSETTPIIQMRVFGISYTFRPCAFIESFQLPFSGTSIKFQIFEQLFKNDSNRNIFSREHLQNVGFTFYFGIFFNIDFCQIKVGELSIYIRELGYES